MLVIALTGTFTGMVVALQGFPTLRRVGSEALLGPMVSLSLIRELGPVLTALMVTGRAGFGDRGGDRNHAHQLSRSTPSN